MKKQVEGTRQPSKSVVSSPRVKKDDSSRKKNHKKPITPSQQQVVEKEESDNGDDERPPTPMTMRALQFYQSLDSKKQRGVSVDVKNIYSLFQSSTGGNSPQVSRR